MVLVVSPTLNSWWGVLLGGGEYARLLDSGIWIVASAHKADAISAEEWHDVPDDVLAMSTRVKLVGWELVMDELLNFPDLT